MALHEAGLRETLGECLIAFGEWCAARHSLGYSSLPDWWLLFDIYDRRTQKFWSTRRRDALASKLQLAVVPRLAAGHQTLASLREMVTRSRSHYRDGALEGVVVRREDENSLLKRGKLVRADFAQSIDTHWRSRSLEWNRLRQAGEPA